MCLEVNRIDEIVEHDDRFLAMNNVPCEECEYCGVQYFKEIKMIELEYSLIIEATEESDYFGFYSPDSK